MKKNIGKVDRIIRLVIACALFIYAILQSSWIIGLISLFVFYESVSSWCAFYQLIGKNTCEIPRK